MIISLRGKLERYDQAQLLELVYSKLIQAHDLKNHFSSPEFRNDKLVESK